MKPHSNKDFRIPIKVSQKRVDRYGVCNRRFHLLPKSYSGTKNKTYIFTLILAKMAYFNLKNTVAHGKRRIFRNFCEIDEQNKLNWTVFKTRFHQKRNASCFISTQYSQVKKRIAIDVFQCWEGGKRTQNKKKQPKKERNQ